MQYLDLTLPTPEENLGCDEALLDLCEAGYDREILRLWESPTPFVVLGHGNRAADEVNLDACRRASIPILRRTSGGGAVLQGPGCVNFSLILRIPESGPLARITSTNVFITDRHAEALRPILGPLTQTQGLSDIALGSLKFSGNAQRRKRRWLFFHGTFLRDFDIPLIERALAMPTRQPEYRRNRSHQDFLTNVAMTPKTLRATLRDSWDAFEEFTDIPFAEIARLSRTQFASDRWNHKF